MLERAEPSRTTRREAPRTGFEHSFARSGFKPGGVKRGGFARRGLACFARLCAVALPLLAACAPEPGRFDLTFVWEDGAPQQSYQICMRLEPDQGGSAIGLAPASYEPGAGNVRIDVPSVPHGRVYSVIVDVAADCAGSRIEYHGAAPILLEPGASFRHAAAITLERTPYGAESGLEIPAARSAGDDRVAVVAGAVVDLHVWPEKTTRVAVALDQNFTLGLEERALTDLAGDANPRVWPAWNLCGPALLSGDLGCEDGLKQVFVKFLNAAGLPSERFERVVSLDTRAPSLDQLSVEPGVARGGAGLTIRLTANEPLDACPELEVDAPLTLGGCGAGGEAMVEPQRCEYCTTIGVDLLEGSYAFSGHLVDRVGHESEAFAGIVQVDQTEPALTESASLRAETDEVSLGQPLIRAGQKLHISFRVAEALTVPARVDVGGQLAECAPPEIDPLTQYEFYSCEFEAEVNTGDGPRAVSAVLQDRAGHTSRLDLGAALFDVDLPSAINTSLLREPVYLPAIGTERIEFSATDPFTGNPVSARLTVFANKQPEVEPELSVLPLEAGACPSEAPAAERLAFHRCNAATDGVCPSDSQVLEYVYTFSSEEREAEYCLVLAWQNRQGDLRSEQLPVRLALALTPPPSAIDFTQTVHVRVPWGAEHTAGAPSFSVAGQLVPGPSGQRPLDVAEVLVSSRPSVSALLGRSVPDGAGEFEVRLSDGDRVEVYAAHVSRSGNVSAFLPITHGEWVATLGGKQPGSPFENPHAAFEWGSAPEVLAPDEDGVEISGETWGRADAQSTSTYARLRWQEQLRSASPPARSRHAMAYDARRGRVVMFGGLASNGASLADTWEWDGRSWRQIEPALGVAPVAREGHAMTYHAASGYILLFGGVSTSTTLGDTWLWDGRRWLQTNLDGETPSIRAGHALAYDARRGVAVLFGGSNQGGLISPAPDASETWEWNGASWRQIDTPITPSARERFAMAFDVQLGQVVLVAGAAIELVDGLFEVPLSRPDRWTWNGADWNEETPIAAGVRDHSLVYDPNADELLLLGGSQCDFSFDPSFCFPILAPDLLLSGNTGDPLAVSGSSPPPRREHAMAFDVARGKAVLFGGNNQLESLGDTWEWDGAQHTWRQAGPAVGSGPRARSSHALGYLPETGDVILFGGELATGGAFTMSAETWSWDGSDWQELSPPGAPAARRAHALSYDVSRGQLLLFGGQADNAPAFNDLWSFRASDLVPAVWELVDPGSAAACAADAAAPCGRRDHGLSHDGQLLLLLGGGPTGAGTALADFWSWDDAWQRVVTPLPPDCASELGPCARAEHGFACDPPASPEAAPTCTLFGGAPAIGEILGDTWSWNGERWLRHQPSGALPAPRASASFTEDTRRRRAMLFGGLNAQVDFDDSWEWDGATWLDVSPLPGSVRPLPRSAHAAAYAEQRSEGVLFGGVRPQQRLGDTWVWRAPDAPAHSVRLALEALAPASRLPSPGAAPSASDVTLDRVSVAALSGGSGTAAPTTGASVRAWEGVGWSEPGASNDAPATEPDPLCWTFGADGPAALLAGRSGNTLNFQFRPVADTGSGPPARLSTDYVEVRVAYHLGEGSPAPRRGRSAYCP